MKELILATIETYKNQFIIKVTEFGLEYKGNQTVAPMCRLIMANHPECYEFGMDIYRDGKLALQVANIGRMSELSFSDEEDGIKLQKYRPIDKSRFKSGGSISVFGGEP